MYRQFLRQMLGMFDVETQTQIRRRLLAALERKWDDAFLPTWDPRGAEGARMHPGRVIVDCYLGETHYTPSAFRAFCFDRVGRQPDALLAGAEPIDEAWAAALAEFFDYSTPDAWTKMQSLYDSYVADFAP